MSIIFANDMKITKDEMHLLSKLDEELFFNNAKKIYIERPDKSFEEKRGDNPPIAFWMMTGDEGSDIATPEPIYIVIEYRPFEFSKFKKIHICRRKSGKQYNGNIKENFHCSSFNWNDLKEKGFNMGGEYDYNTIGQFLNKELYEKYFEEYESLGYKDTMFAGW